MLSIDLTTALSVALLVFAGWPGSAGRNRWIGRLTVLLLLSPGLRYFSALFTFPIRLQLSGWSGHLLRLAGLTVQAEGNVLIKNGVEMAVDPACMGLQLTGISLLWAFFALIWQERQAQKAAPFGWVVVFGLLTFSLTIGANLFRIVLLVAFDAMPGTLAHEVIGLVCVAIYTWLPAWILARQLVTTVGQIEQQTTKQVVAKSVGWGVGLLAVGLGVMAFAARPVMPIINLHQQEQILATINAQHQAGCQYKTLTNGFVQLAKPGVLIYLKPQPDWFSADHSPMACWRGSGYELRRVRETTLDGHPAYVGELRKKGNVLHTAWWFSNGTTTTISQFTLRTRMLQGESGFALVNVTLATEP
jgi:exosortase N